MFIKCECGSEGLFVEHEEGMYYISIVSSHEHQFKLSWLSRLKIALKIFFTGKLYNDQIILSKHEANKLVGYLHDTGTNYETVKSYTVDEMYMNNGT